MQNRCGILIASLALLASDASAAAGLISKAKKAGIHRSPENGAPYLEPKSLEPLPGIKEDAGRADIFISRLNSRIDESQRNSASAHACDQRGTRADKNKCLSVDNRECMWMQFATHDPSVGAFTESAYCMPCEIDGEDMPCMNPGAWIGEKQVKACAMSCLHQKRITQPQYACSDAVGPDSQSSCFSRGKSSNSKCMFLEFKDSTGVSKSSCAPCEVQGVGLISCPEPGHKGPEDGSSVTNCLSQCDTVSHFTATETATVIGSNPGATMSEISPDTMMSAPVAPKPLAEEIRDLHRSLPKQGIDALHQAPPTNLEPKYVPVVIYKSKADSTDVVAAIPPLPERLPWPTR
eukprot:TRINITY_DN15807_c0_g1_i1.p1 TRINITY_DN15807_c0_g1~~TRINITY_DN15807_c0_g1_i1.p1  ORF type:complete len:349 (-),score=50.28 TRINITY_DN15807_c0_g1_i1:322-1368(-)